MNSRFSVRSTGTRWLMAMVVALWSMTGTAAMPLMSASECADMAMNAGCDRSQHHAATPHHTSKESPSPQQHDCCKKKPKAKPAPTKATMPMCPMHEGTMPQTCGSMAEVTCCAVMSRDETRRTAKTEKSNDNESPTLLMAKARPGPSPAVFDRHDRHLQDGLRYEKPVFDLKTDLRI